VLKPANDVIFGQTKASNKYYNKSLGIKYYLRDLISDVNCCAWPAWLRYGS